MRNEFRKREKYDVIVAGGGVAGAAAAAEASKHGKKVLLIEKTVQLGGLATIGLINLFVPMCNGRGVQIIKGMAEEFFRLSIKYGYDTIPKDWQRGEPGQGNTSQRYITRFSAPVFSLALMEYLTETGVKVLFDTVITDVETENRHIKGVYTYNKSGFEYYEADMFIDTTGDGDVMHRAGVPTVKGGNYHTYIAFCASLESCKRAYEAADIASLTYFKHGGRANLYGGGHPEGMKLWDGTDGDEISEYVRINQLELLEDIKNEDRKARDLTILPSMCQFRTVRHIDGEYTLKEDDKYKHFDDSVCAISDFERRDCLYEVPFGTLVKRGFDNIITAGRSACADGYAWDVLRVIPPAILTGQAAGAAAAQAVDSRLAIYDIDIRALQRTLENENVMIHFDDALIPEDIEKIEKSDIGHI